MYELTPLGVDTCRSATGAPCRYWHLKCRAMATDLRAALEPAARRDLLRVLTSESEVRADVHQALAGQDSIA